MEAQVRSKAGQKTVKGRRHSTSKNGTSTFDEVPVIQTRGIESVAHRHQRGIATLRCCIDGARFLGNKTLQVVWATGFWPGT